jgi:hypothetical protein
VFGLPIENLRDASQDVRVCEDPRASGLDGGEQPGFFLGRELDEPIDGREEVAAGGQLMELAASDQ